MSTANIIGNAIFGLRNKSGGNYIDPAVNESLVGLWKFDQNTNESPTRNIIKNTIKDKGGDLELLNFAYKANSGYNGYPEDFTSWDRIDNNTAEISDDGSKIKCINTILNVRYLFASINRDVPSFKVKISNFTKGNIAYYYHKEDGTGAILKIGPLTVINSDGVLELPKSYNTVENGTGGRGGFYSSNINIGVTIEQLPLYEGALVTDGKDDMIVSQKTVQEMGITDEITVVSMIHQIGIRSEYNRAFNNYIRNQNVGFIRNNIAEVGIGKTGIYGYTWNNSTKSVINNILGDKNDYSIEVGNSVSIEGKFTVEGCIKNDSPDEISGVAVYWTFIANKVLTTDEINQIIGYYKLDKYVTPQVIYDVKRQGLTNNTPAADWYLKDFSGNGHDMQLYNYAKELNSGVGKYAENFTTWNKYNNVVVTKDKITVTDKFNQYWLVYKHSKSSSGISPMRIKITGIPINARIEYRYAKTSSDTALSSFDILEDGVYDIPESFTINNEYSVGFKLSAGNWTHIEITQIPDYEGALVSDGKDDYGHADNLPIFKDYTVAIDRAIIGTNKQVAGGVSAKCLKYNNGSYVIDYLDGSFSYGGYLPVMPTIDRIISYQSKYISNGKAISPVNTIDANEIYIAKLGIEERYSTIAVWSYLLFPYTLSEFLLERQLKKYKLGTLYPDMVEFRPIIKNNNQYRRIDFYTQSWDKKIYPGDYVPINSILRANIYLNNESSELQSFRINGVNVTFAKSSVDKTAYTIGNIPIAKSPQKIDITIDEYIRFEDIIQPYPAIVNLSQDGKSITWGDKLKVGSEVTFVNHTNLLPDLYTVSGGVQYNGTSISWNTSIRVEKSMVFVNPHSYKKANEPNCILAPQTLRIPNSSYKILGYIPDLTGKGNHGRLNNFAYTEESGANEDGSIRFDGTDDHIIIPTIKHGGKALLMKMNWRYKNNIAMAYDQRINWVGFSISRDQLPLVAYKPYNKVTYIDGIKNESVLVQDLEGITHNITGIYGNLNLRDERDVCISRTSDASNSGFTDMSMYEFMLFTDVPNEEEIKELNDIVGIEGNVWGTLTQLINSTLISNETLIKNE